MSGHVTSGIPSVDVEVVVTIDLDDVAEDGTPLENLTDVDLALKGWEVIRSLKAPLVTLIRKDGTRVDVDLEVEG